MYTTARYTIVFTLVTAAACSHNVAAPDLAASVRDTTNLVARGEYIVRSVAACGTCHAAEPRRNADGPLSGGMEFHDWRLGTIRAANLTADSATGLGTWTTGEIVRAIRNGEAKDGSLLAPVMPYEWFHDMSDRDALAVARYLQSLPPVHNEVRENPNLLFDLARATFMGPKPGTSADAPPRGPTAEYGEYLSRHVALCAECHTPRGGVQSRPDMSRLFAGNAHPPAGFPAKPANLTPDSATGIGTWSEADFLRTLRTGVNPRGDSLHPFMPWREVGRMTDDDLRAIHSYLRTLAPIANAVPRHAAAR